MGLENKKEKILLVDDDFRLLQSLERNLKRNFDITTASCGTDGILKVVESDFAVVVSDYQMPGISGVEFLMEVKDLSPATTRIMLTGQADMSVALEALNKGNVFRFLEKPTNVSAVERVIFQGIKEYKLYIETQNQISYDSLTECYNRKTIMEHLHKELERSRRYSRSISVAMIDIDHFKRVNDTLGHLTGDVVLKKVVKAIKLQIREVDIIGRYGGEEFLLLLPESTLVQATIVCERIRETIFNMKFDEYADLKVSISIGLAEYNEENATDFLNLIDKLLYRAKHNGRNCVVTQTIGKRVV